MLVVAHIAGRIAADAFVSTALAAGVNVHWLEVQPGPGKPGQTTPIAAIKAHA